MSRSKKDWRSRRRKAPQDCLTEGQKIMFTPTVFNQIEAEAASRGVSVSHIVRECVYDKLHEIGLRDLKRTD